MAGVRSLTVRILGDSSSLEKALARSSSAGKKYQQEIGLVAKAHDGFARSAAFAATTLLGGAGVVSALHSSIDAAVKSQEVQRRSQQQLEALGISYQQHAKHIDEVIRKQSNLAALDDEDLQSSFTNLVRVTKDVNRALELNGIAADVARGKNVSLEAATAIVTKASLGQLGALKRMGVEIQPVTSAVDALKDSKQKYTQAELAAAKAADATATRQQALQQLQKQFAGQAEAYGKTAAGAQERLKVATENLQESIGTALLPTVEKVSNAVSGWLAKDENLQKVQDGVNKVVETATKVMGELWPHIKKAAEFADTLAQKVGGWDTALEIIMGGLLLRKIEGITGALVGKNGLLSALERIGGRQFSASVTVNVAARGAQALLSLLGIAGTSKLGALGAVGALGFAAYEGMKEHPVPSDVQIGTAAGGRKVYYSPDTGGYRMQPLGMMKNAIPTVATEADVRRALGDAGWAQAQKAMAQARAMKPVVLDKNLRTTLPSDWHYPKTTGVVTTGDGTTPSPNPNPNPKPTGNGTKDKGLEYVDPIQARKDAEELYARFLKKYIAPAKALQQRAAAERNFKAGLAATMVGGSLFKITGPGTQLQGGPMSGFSADVTAASMESTRVANIAEQAKATKALRDSQREAQAGMIRDRVAAMAAAVDSSRNGFQAAWSRLGEAAQQAIEAKYTKMRDDLAGALKQQLKEIDKVRAELTPAEAELQALLDARDEQSRQDALAAAMASGDAKQVEEAQFQITVAGLRKRAAEERKAKDEKANADAEAAQAAYDAATTRLNGEEKAEKDSYADRLSELGKYLDERGIAVDEANTAVSSALGEFATGLDAQITEMLNKLASLRAAAAGGATGFAGSIAASVPTNERFFYPMASGGDFAVTGPTLFLAGEAGPERATFSRMGGRNYHGGGPVTVISPIILDGQEIGRSVRRHIIRDSISGASTNVITRSRTGV